MEYEQVFDRPDVIVVLDGLKQLTYKALKKGFSEQQVIEALYKLSQSAFYFANMDIDFDNMDI